MERFETHLSVVLVDGDFAWKRKKPLKFDFVDFSTLAPAIYLGVAPLHGDLAGELRLGAFDLMGGVSPPAAIAAAAPWAPLREPHAPIVDWCVVMRRLPAAGMLDAVVARGAFDAAAAAALAERLARFHRAARIEEPAERAAAAGAAAQERRQRRLLAEAQSAAAALDRRGIGPPVLPPRIASALAAAGERFLRDRAELYAPDATFSTAVRRAAAEAVARRCGAPFVVVHCRAEERTIEARLARRAGERGHASDADLTVYRAARDRFEPPTEPRCRRAAKRASRPFAATATGATISRASRSGSFKCTCASINPGNAERFFPSSARTPSGRGPPAAVTAAMRPSLTSNARSGTTRPASRSTIRTGAMRTGSSPVR